MNVWLNGNARSHFGWKLPPLVHRIESGRPVMTREQAIALAKKVLSMATLPDVRVSVSHTVSVITRMSNNRVLLSDDGETIKIGLGTTLAQLSGGAGFDTNQLDDSVLLAAVQQCEEVIRTRPDFGTENWMKEEAWHQDTPVPVQLWHDPTVQAMKSARESVVPEFLETVRKEQLQGAGFVGIMAHSAVEMVRTTGDVTFFHEETDSEINFTVRSRDGKSVGWGGQAARDWSEIRADNVARHAIETCKRGMNPVAMEPGRRTAILTPEAIVQMVRYFGDEWDAKEANGGSTALSKTPYGGNKLHERIFDPRISMKSDPADPEGGYRPYYKYFGVANPPMVWVENGILKNMSYGYPNDALEAGKPYVDHPRSFRLSGGTTSVEQMISQCQEGILVNRVSDVELVDKRTCLLTGVTQGGCFWVKNGKIEKAVKNFRFLTSPFFFMNSIDALGVPKRAAFGYTPAGRREYWVNWTLPTGRDWPRPPIIVPPMMVRDFNFSSLADAI